MGKLKALIKGVNNLYLCLVILVAVCAVLLVVPPILRGTTLNSVNRIYDEYDRIERISTDYVLEEITITVTPIDWFDTHGNSETYKLSQIYESPLFEIDNSVTAPTMVDGIVHIPDTYPR